MRTAKAKNVLPAIGLSQSRPQIILPSGGDDRSDEEAAPSRHSRRRPSSTKHQHDALRSGSFQPGSIRGTTMPRVRSCLTPHESLDRISSRLLEDVDIGRVKRWRSWIRNDLALRLNRRGGHRVSASEMEPLIGIFSYIVFWNQLPTTRFRWVRGLVIRDSAYGTTNAGGTIIERDPDKNKRGCKMADNLLSTLLHECCHAILEQQTCRGRCG